MVSGAAEDGGRVSAAGTVDRAAETRRRACAAGDDPKAGGVLLTGATGFLGMEVLARYLERTDRRVYALVRGPDDRAVAARLERTLHSLFGEGHSYGERVVAVRGDITRAGLDLGEEGDRLAAHISEIVHGAASVSFELDLQAAREVNVEGTRRVLEFAERCWARGRLRRLSHLSTAYVAGDHAGRFAEEDLDVGQRFRNPYERSKFEAEVLVARWRARLPITVLRPSIIVGDSHTGWTSSFNVLYWPLRAFARGAYLALPARRDAPVDVVPVDYVADAVIALTEQPDGAGETYHLVAGADATTVGELAELAAAHFGRPPPRLITPSVYRRMLHPLLVHTSRSRRRRLLVRSEVFFPYFSMAVAYDDRRSRAALAAADIAPAPLPRYFDRLVQFALAAEWGRSQISRASAGIGQAPAHPRRPAAHPAATRAVLAR
jgi:long-chain acyl-CoA synthetase